MSLKNGTDIRGIASEGSEYAVNLTDETVVAIAKAFCLWLAKKRQKTKLTVAVGHDSRISAPRLKACMERGITESGCVMVDTALSSTPSMFMLLQDASFLPCDGSVMLTASHLPFYRNGMKFFVKEGGLEGKDIAEILQLAKAGEFLSGKGEVIRSSYLDKYSADLVALFRKATGEERPLAGKRIVVDAGNGAGGFYVSKVLQPLGADTEGSQFLEPDGTFPNHIPNPENEAAMQSVCAAVKRVNADFGIIFDTDVDRAGAVDGNGEEINRNRLIALISAILLEEKPGTIVTDSVTSEGLAAFLAAHGGRHHRFKRGYKNVINEAIRLNAAGEYTPLAIETSGHAALKENYFLDDGAYLVTRILIALAKEAKKGKNVTELIADLPEPKEATEIRLNFQKDVDFKTLGNGLIADLTRAAKDIAYITPAPENFEGIRLNFDKAHGNGWTLVRMSLHEPILPINVESDEEGGCKRIIAFLDEFLSAYPFLDLTNLKKHLK